MVPGIVRVETYRFLLWPSGAYQQDSANPRSPRDSRSGRPEAKEQLRLQVQITGSRASTMTSAKAAMVPDVFRGYLSKLLSNHSKGITVEKFAVYFMNQSTDRIKYEMYGYASLTDMLEDLPDVCKVERTPHNAVVYPVEEALKLRGRYRLDRRSAPARKKESDTIEKVVTSFGDLILLKFHDGIYVPTCCLAQLAGFTRDRVLEILEEDGLRVSGVRCLTLGNRDHDKLRLKIALWCPLARSDSNRIQEVRGTATGQISGSDLALTCDSVTLSKPILQLILN